MSHPTDFIQFKAPLVGLARPGTLRSDGKKSSVSVQKEWNELTWNVSSLEQVPLGFPLERTHREIHDADASEVATRISNALKCLSIEAEYDAENAKVKCTSGCMVSFRIRLFAGSDEGLPVVVEVQRRGGSPLSFMKICRQILYGAEGAEVKAEAAAKRKMPPFLKGPIRDMKCLQGVVKKEENNGYIEALNKSMELLKSKQKDCNILGLKGLCLLTDPIKTNADLALKACKAIIIEDRCSDLREELCVILQKKAFEPEGFCVEDIKPLAKQSHHLTLCLWSNLVALTSKDGCLATAVESKTFFADVLIPALINEAKSFKRSSNNAHEATCGLASLANSSDFARELIEYNGAVEVFLSAYHYGLAFHELLASEAEQALIAMGVATV
jgi:hypothetical protein